jgi:hypothetical protein
MWQINPKNGHDFSQVPLSFSLHFSKSNWPIREGFALSETLACFIVQVQQAFLTAEGSPVR